MKRLYFGDLSDDEDIGEEEKVKKVYGKPLKLQNSHVRDRRIEMDEDHVYWLDGEKPFDVTVTSMTNLVYPKFDPENVFKYIFKNQHNGRSMSTNPKYRNKTRKEILDGWSGKADFGTNVHALIEEYLENKPVEMFEATQSIDKRYEKIVGDRKVGPKTEQCVKQFIDFDIDFEKQGWQPYRVEWLVYDEDIGLGGTIDALYFRLNKISGDIDYVMVDWKCIEDTIDKSYNKECLHPLSGYMACKRTKFTLQLNLYAYVLERKYGIKCSDLFIIQLTGNKKHSYKKHKLVRSNEEVERIIDLYQNHKELKAVIEKWEREGAIGSDVFPETSHPLRIELKDEYAE